MIIKKNNIKIFLIYWILSTGTIIQSFYFGMFTPLYFLSIFILLYISLDSLKINKNIEIKIIIFLLSTFYLYYFLQTHRAEHFEVLIRRLDGGLLSSLILIALVYSLSKNNNEHYIFDKLRVVFLFMLIFVVLYKIQFGFWNRMTRYLINGPIVFGWISGLLIISLYVKNIYTVETIKLEKNNEMITYIILFLCLFWSMSKGPILALIITLMFLNIFGKKIKLRTIFLFVFTLIFLFGVLFFLDNYFNLPSVERLMTILRVLSGSTGEIDEGSVGIRQKMWIESVGIIKNSWLYGVGPTNWASKSDYGILEYPHNIYVELLVETGFFGLFLFLLIQIVVFTSGSILVRSMVIYFSICSSFSGDISYIRFHLAIPIGLLLSKINEKTIK